MSTVNRWSLGLLQIPSAPAAGNISSPLRRSLGPSRNPSHLSCFALSLTGADGPAKDGRSVSSTPRTGDTSSFQRNMSRVLQALLCKCGLVATSARKLPHRSANPAAGACTLWVKCEREADENTGFCTTQFTALVDPCILFLAQI